jgi:ribosomal protein L3 glutamine methyltransferase
VQRIMWNCIKLKQELSQEITKLTTIVDILRWATTQFAKSGLYFGHGTDNAWDDALALIFSVLHLPHDVTQQVLLAKLTPLEKEEILHVLRQRIEQRIPVPYLTHEAWFAGLPFYVDERVLIPRSPMAELIENQFVPWMEPHQILNVLDLCTGSGCLAIACAHYLPHAMVDAVDICENALAVADRNRRKHHLEERVRIIQSDLFQNISTERYDLIVSNPPYVSAKEMRELPAEYGHEPHHALQADDNGLALVVKILASAANHLTDHGCLIVEVGNSEHALVTRFPKILFTWLEFERGGQGVFLLTAKQCRNYSPHC